MPKLLESNIEVHISIPCEGERLQHVLKAEKHLRLAGITFDTGYGFGCRDWEFDWSLEGATITKVREKGK